jgi:hypothetical protein
VAVHVKKCNPDSFHAISKGIKSFEYRREDDCKYEVGDVLILMEYKEESKEYTGNIVRCEVTYVLRGKYGVPDGYAVLSVKRGASNVQR